MTVYRLQAKVTVVLVRDDAVEKRSSLRVYYTIMHVYTLSHQLPVQLYNDRIPSCVNGKKIL